MEQKLLNALSRLSASYLRDPVGTRQPSVNGIEVVESRESVEVNITSAFTSDIDQSMAREIVELGSMDSSDIIELKTCVSDDNKLHFNFLFRREKLVGISQENIATISQSLATFRERLKVEVLSSKVQLSHDIRTAISNTSRVYASHASMGIHGA